MHAVIKDAEARMQKCIVLFKQEISKLRTGRAHPSLLDHVRVNYYGNDVPISQVATITIGDARTLVISPWEKNMIPVIEKAIMTCGLGLNPATSGDLIRIPLPALTEERRKEFVKMVRQEAETARVAVRNVRRDANTALKEYVKKKEMTEDEEHRLMDHIQKLTDTLIKEIDHLLSTKEHELMSI